MLFSSYSSLLYLYKNSAVSALRRGNFATARLLPAACAMPADCAKPTISLELSAKSTILGSWRPRRPADGPPGAQDGLRRATRLLTPQTASDGPSPADKITCRQVHQLHKSALAPSEPSTPALFCRSRRTPFFICFNEPSATSSGLQVNSLAHPLTVVALCDGFTLVLVILFNFITMTLICSGF